MIEKILQILRDNPTFEVSFLTLSRGESLMLRVADSVTRRAIDKGVATITLEDDDDVDIVALELDHAVAELRRANGKDDDAVYQIPEETG